MRLRLNLYQFEIAFDSIKPVFLLPAALASRGEGIARDFIDSLVVGSGQFCTNPGIVLALEGAALDAFCAHAGRMLACKPAATMLRPSIHAAYCTGVEHLGTLPGVQRIATGQAAREHHGAQAALFLTTAQAFLADGRMEDEIFGPGSLVVGCADFDEMRRLASRLAGQLTATLQYDEADHDYARQLLPALERKAGRILCNGFPTGVEVSHAMVHGGPFPPTSDSRCTSVGSAAIDRFLHPVCYQSVPDALLPDALREVNPLGIWRLRDGQLIRR